MKRRLSSCALLLLLSVGVNAVGQDAAERAETAFQSKNWAEAAALYEQLTQASPNIGRYWYRLGISEQGRGNHERALAALTKAREKGVLPAMVDYNLACVYASMNRRADAIAKLDQALQGGFALPEQMAAEADLAVLRSDAKFPELLEKAKRNQQPCEYRAESRQFDFWIGDWKVSPSEGGGQVGASHIEKTLGGCVIWENWTSLATGYSGKSYNTYNPDLQRWEQFWVDNQGGMIHFYGGLKDGVMDFWTDDMPQPGGEKLRRHLQFFRLSADKVRQFSQGSTDGGKTWKVEYDFTYVRTKSS